MAEVLERQEKEHGVPGVPGQRLDIKKELRRAFYDILSMIRWTIILSVGVNVGLIILILIINWIKGG